MRKRWLTALLSFLLTLWGSSQIDFRATTETVQLQTDRLGATLRCSSLKVPTLPERELANVPSRTIRKRAKENGSNAFVAATTEMCVCPIFVSRSAVERKSLCSTRQLRDTTASEDAFTSATVCQSASNQQSRLILKCWSMLLFLLLLSILRLFSFF